MFMLICLNAYPSFLSHAYGVPMRVHLSYISRMSKDDHQVVWVKIDFFFKLRWFDRWRGVLYLPFTFSCPGAVTHNAQDRDTAAHAHSALKSVGDNFELFSQMSSCSGWICVSRFVFRKTIYQIPPDRKLGTQYAGTNERQCSHRIQEMYQNRCFYTVVKFVAVIVL